MTSIFVAKLDFGVTKEQLTELFEEYGKVNRVNIPTDKETGKPRGFAFVEMFDPKEAESAISALDGYEINRRSLAVKLAENRGDTKRTPGKSFSNSNKDSQHSTPKTTSSENTSRSTSDFSSQEQRKKSSKSRKRSFDNDGERGKKTKMQAHKKSGKSFRYIEEEEPLENDLFLFDKDEDESFDEN